MGSILDFINRNNENNLRCYDTKKIALDESINSVLYEDVDEVDTEISDFKAKIAETNHDKVDWVPIPVKYLNRDDEPLFKYFLDGTRKIYKVGDIPIGNQVYPILAGQIIVACCHRPNRNKFCVQGMPLRSFVISLPKSLKKYGKDEDFARDFLEKLNLHLNKTNSFARKTGLEFSKVFLYDIDGSSLAKEDKDRFVRSAKAKIQYEMADLEQIMVRDLCAANPLNMDENWLIKDGSIQYNSNYSFIEKSEWQKMRANYKYVIGVCKNFNPGLLKGHNGKPLTRAIAELPHNNRTKAYIYESSMSKDENGNKMPFAVWYVRLREKGKRESQISDVIKCEMLMNEGQVDTSLIDYISANLIHEAYPVCYGKDARWARHLYPVYLTETFCKSLFLNGNLFMNLF